MANKTKRAANEGGEIMEQTICNRCGIAIPEMTKKEFKKAKNPNGYNIILTGIRSANGDRWQGACGHLCRGCHDQLFKVLNYAFGKHDC